MAKYRKKPIDPEIVEAIEWTGGNLEEVKNLLGDCFVEVDASKKIVWFKRWPKDDLIDWVPSKNYMILKNRYDMFSCQDKKDFLECWEEVTEDGTC